MAVATSTRLERLRWIDLSGNGIRDQGFRSLSEWLGKNLVEKLDLTHNPVCVDPPAFPWWTLRNRLYV